MKIVISLGGSLIFPDSLNLNYIKKFRKIILKHSKNFSKMGIIVGGGKLAREYQNAAKPFKLSDYDLDMLGIMATRINAELIRTIFANKAYKEVIYNPSKKIKTKKKIIVGAGYKPGFSTDHDAVLLARNLNCKKVINLTNVDYVYDKDPRKYKANPIKEIEWKQFRKIFGNKWKPGLNSPFDPLAAKAAQKYNIEVLVANGKKLNNLENILRNKGFKGTTIK